MTNIKNETIAIFDGDKKTVVLDMGNDMARLLFFDRDKTLLEAAENEALKAGKIMMVYDFCSRDADAKEFLKENGFKIEETGDIYTASIDELFSAGVISRMGSLKEEGYEWIPFRDLIFYQAMELIDVLREQKIPISSNDLLRFNGNLSGVVYDSEGKIAAYNFVSEMEDDLLLECLNSCRKAESEPLFPALYGMAAEMEKCNIEENFESLYLYDISTRKMSIAKEIVSGACDINAAYKTLCAKKILRKKSSQSESTELVMDYDAENMLGGIAAERILKIPFQCNINWKTRWGQ